MVKKAVSISNFILRHFVASVVSLVAPIVLLVFAYFVLFLIAIFTNSGLGSPIALPLWAILIFAISTIYTAILLFPSVLIAEATAHILGKWQHIIQIPISTLVLAILTYIASLVARLLPNYAETIILHWADNPFVVFLVLAIPLGVYWWTMKAVQIGISFPVVLFKRLRKASE